MDDNLKIIDPTSRQLPEGALIEKVQGENNRLPSEEHDKAVRAFFVSDGIASGIGKDLAFVDKIPQFIDEIIQEKAWECLYVAKGVVTPYYCRYLNGTDSENFRAFIAAKRPNGLETSVETIERVLQGNPEIQRRFRALIYESRQGERTDLGDETSYGDRKKLGEELNSTQRSVIRATTRAAQALPVIEDLLDRGLIAIDVAAKLGRDIKDPNNLTAEEREYVDKRDLIGFRIEKYIYTNPIPEDEDREPAYARELNRYIKDLLGIKDRSKSIRMDSPKKAAEKLLQFYQGDKLKELIDLLSGGLQVDAEIVDIVSPPVLSPAKLEALPQQDDSQMHLLNPQPIEVGGEEKGAQNGQTNSPKGEAPKLLEPDTQKTVPSDLSTMRLNASELADRLGRKMPTLLNCMYNTPEDFPRWTQKLDPDDLRWQRVGGKKGKHTMFMPITNTTDSNNQVPSET